MASPDNLLCCKQFGIFFATFWLSDKKIFIAKNLCARFFRRKSGDNESIEHFCEKNEIMRQTVVYLEFIEYLLHLKVFT